MQESNMFSFESSNSYLWLSSWAFSFHHI